MNIHFFGSSLVSSYWNGAATYYRGILGELAGRGHRITFYEPDAYNRQQNRDMEDPDWATIVVYPAGHADEVHRTVQQAAGGDLIVKASGVGVHDELLEAAIPTLKNSRNQVIFWDVDAPATLDRMLADPADPFRPLVAQYDMILTYGGGNPVVEAYRKCGARQCTPIYNAVDPATHHPVPPHPKYSADLAFLGNRLPDREARVEEFFLNPASQLPERRFLMGGSGWADKALPANVTSLGHVPTADHNSFNCTPLAVLNINRESMARYGFSPPTRVFEATGAGACLLTDAWEGLELFLEPDKEVLSARDGNEVTEHMASLTEARARAIGSAARRRIAAEHTYAHRVDQLETLLDLPTLRPCSPPLRESAPPPKSTNARPSAAPVA